MSDRREHGFTLIEVAAALGVFAVAMLGLTLVFDQALKSTSQVRFDEVGKTVAQRKLEEIRALPLYIPQTKNTGDVDVLDLYYPNTTPPAYSGSPNFTYTTSGSVTVEGRSYSLTVVTQFVAPQGDGSLPAKAPISGYNSDVENADQPSTNSLKVTVTVSRTIGGRTRQVSLDTVLAQREETAPVAEASATIEGASVSGVTFQDGDGVGGVPAEIVASVAEAQLAFREVSGSTSQASADPLDLIERHPATSTPLQAEKPAPPSDGAASASVPNSTGDVQVAPSASLAAGIMSSVNGSGAIGAWGSSSPSGTAEARVSTLHALDPEGWVPTVASNLFELNARDAGEADPLEMLHLGSATGSAKQQSTTSSVTVEAAVDLQTIFGPNPNSSTDDRPAATVFASRVFRSNPNYRGVVLIDSIHVDTRTTASPTAATAEVNWRVDELRIWDPNKLNPTNPLNPGGYGDSYTFGYKSSTDCGWVVNPTNCSPGTPPPVEIPLAYKGPTGQSLQIAAGSTVPHWEVKAGFSTASAAQKNVLFITTRDDVTGATPLEPMLIGLGNANLSVYYISHDH